MPAMRTAYERLQRDEGAVPSPWTPDARPLLVDRVAPLPATSGCFLHGAGGSFAAVQLVARW